MRDTTNMHGHNNRGGQNLWKTKAEHANLIDHQTPKAAAPFLVHFIGMFSLGVPEVLPPTIIMTMHIRSMTYIHPFVPTSIYSVPHSMGPNTTMEPLLVGGWSSELSRQTSVMPSWETCCFPSLSLILHVWRVCYCCIRLPPAGQLLQNPSGRNAQSSYRIWIRLW